MRAAKMPEQTRDSRSDWIYPETDSEAAAHFTAMNIALKAVKDGRLVIIVDDKDRENEGDFAIAAEDVTPEVINFMATEGRGLICTPMTGTRLDQLSLPMMVHNNSSTHKTAFTVSVDAASSITTGISSADRARTIQMLVNPHSTRSDFVMPGHVFPLRYQEGGVLVRTGQTEGSVDLVSIAGKQPASVICEIMNPDGTMARRPQLEKISAKHNIPIVSVEDIAAWRIANETLIERLAEAKLPTKFGEFRAIAYKSKIDEAEHIALVKGGISKDKPTLVRVHSECLTGDAFGSLRCECGEQAEIALKRIESEGQGVFVYMRQEGRGIGLLNKIRAYQLQDSGLDTVEANNRLGFPADPRHYEIGAQILRDLGVGKFKLLTNNPKKISGITGLGLEMIQVVPILTKPNKYNRNYLATKRTKMNHALKEDL